MIRNLEIRDDDDGSLVLGGAGSVEREHGYVAAAGFELPDREVEVSDDRIVAGVVYLTRDDLRRIHEWTTETLASAGLT